MKKALVIFSGGMDSATLLWDLCVNEKISVVAVSFNYGQRHRVELDYAKRFIERIRTELLVQERPDTEIAHHIIDLTSITPFLKGSALTDPSVEVPHGHYAAESMKATVVPNRNMIMLSVAAGIAISEKIEGLYYAAHAGDHDIYPDCRKEFADKLGEAIAMADWHRVELRRPFVTISKTDVCAMGGAIGVPYELTWSCYEGQGTFHCGQCGTCVERIEAFKDSGVTDPTKYAETIGA